jgi:nitroreductase
MQLQNTIKRRRSVRKFKTKKPDWRDILDCLDTTRFAPMAGGYYSLKFLILDDKESIEEVAKLADQDFIKEAPYVVIFVSDPGVTKKAYPESGDIYMRQQAGAAMQNFMLSLTEKKLSSCWVGHFDEEKLAHKFGIKGNIEAIFPVGYEKERPKTRGIQASLYNRVSFHIWGNKSLNKPRAIEPYSPKAQ